MKIRDYSKFQDAQAVPNLMHLQIQAYENFLQLHVPPSLRKPVGLEGILRETFPIENYDGSMYVEYLKYDLSAPRFTPDQCRELKVTYGMPFRIWVRLVHNGVAEEPEEVYIGEIPKMIGGGEFIINGSERVIVSQLHRSPGIDFSLETPKLDQKLYKCRIIPDRGSWLELVTTKKDQLHVRIDQTTKCSIITFIKALGVAKREVELRIRKGSDGVELVFSEKEPAAGQKVKQQGENKPDLRLADDVRDPETEEVLAQKGERVPQELVDRLHRHGIRSLTVYEVLYNHTGDILREFYDTKEVKLNQKAISKLAEEKRTYLGEDVRDSETGELLATAGEKLTKELLDKLYDQGVRTITVLENVKDPLLINSLDGDVAVDHDDAIEKIYKSLRPGTPADFKTMWDTVLDKFFNESKYQLGKIGRFRINRKFGFNPEKDEFARSMVLTIQDVIESVRYLLKLRDGQGELDDIDHLGNRRVKTIEELMGDEIRKGFLKLKRTVRERMGTGEEKKSCKSLINAKTVSAAIEYFFARGELSQIVDQTNPLSQLTHERTLSALGPGGLNRKRAGFEVRDVHISHYGRICPIETPEGANIGLISRLAVYATLDKYGFLITPYRRVEKRKITDDVVYLRADEEGKAVVAPSDVPIKNGRIAEDLVAARVQGEVKMVPAEDVEFIDISPKQLVGVSASLIPFLEHDDANRALMGSNMQRQAVPLIRCEPPIVRTGMEEEVARHSGMVVTAEEDGVVQYVDSKRIIIGDKEYRLRKFAGLNDRTCLNQKPLVREGQKVKKGDVIAEGAATKDAILSLGKNVLVAFMPWEGYNFEDAIIVSEKLVRDDVYTSVHIDSFEIKIRETKLGKEEFTNEIPNVSERLRRNLDENGIIYVGSRVKPGDILVGKVVPKSKTELTPEEKLLHAIFGKAGADVKNESLEVPSGVEGIVIETRHFKRNSPYESREEQQRALNDTTRRYSQKIWERICYLFEKLADKLGTPVANHETDTPLHPEDFYGVKVSDHKEQPRLSAEIRRLKEALDANYLVPPVKGKSKKEEEKRLQKVLEVHKLIRENMEKIEELEAAMLRESKRIQGGDELQAGVLELVRVYIATKRRLSVGDKMAGRHGNKGVISKIVPEEDMPFLADGTSVEIILNPLGVPSRMNVGQILETHLGWAAKKLGFTAITPVFAGADEEEIREALREAGLPETGKTVLYDGRTGEPFLEEVTVGYIYMMKLHHLVDDKVHARATGPYSLITQQPLGGKARFGGQRFGEMEVWALEAYGAANILQELLTVKSDDVDGRTKIYESMVKGQNTLEPGTPVSFDVLTNEIKGLCLNLGLYKKKKHRI